MRSSNQFICENKLTGTALFDQVAAILRDAGEIPVAPRDLCAQLGLYRLWSVECGHADICQNPKHRRDLGLLPYTGQDIRGALKKLERQGLAERHVPDSRSGRTHYWRWIGPS